MVMPEQPPTYGGRPDLERVGLFNEIGYLDRSTATPPPQSARAKGKQLQTSPPKRQVYFREFTRTFEGEGYTDLVALRRKDRRESAKKNIASQDFRPASVPQNSSGRGSIYGTLEHTYPLEHMLPMLDPREPDAPKSPETKPNIYTNPAKQGGFGYLQGTINRLPEYISSPYARKHDMDREYDQASKAHNVTPKGFISSCSARPYFDNKAFVTRPFTFGKDPKVPAPAVAWKPSSTAQPYLNKFPPYDPHNPFPPKAEIEAAIHARVHERREAGPSTDPTYRPINTAMHKGPVRSIIEMNVSKRPPKRASVALASSASANSKK
ncbi:hypothetical protein RI367_005453 [Sorochytrium milnesiophthora]